jgi:hypothetical protein
MIEKVDEMDNNQLMNENEVMINVGDDDHQFENFDLKYN